MQAAEADAALLVSRLEVAQAELEGERAMHRREMRKKAREVQEVRYSWAESAPVAAAAHFSDMLHLQYLPVLKV